MSDQWYKILHNQDTLDLQIANYSQNITIDVLEVNYDK